MRFLFAFLLVGSLLLYADRSPTCSCDPTYISPTDVILLPHAIQVNVGPLTYCVPALYVDARGLYFKEYYLPDEIVWEDLQAFNMEVEKTLCLSTLSERPLQKLPSPALTSTDVRWPFFLGRGRGKVQQK